MKIWIIYLTYCSGLFYLHPEDEDTTVKRIVALFLPTDSLKTPLKWFWCILFIWAIEFHFGLKLFRTHNQALWLAFLYFYENVVYPTARLSITAWIPSRVAEALQPIAADHRHIEAHNHSRSHLIYRQLGVVEVRNWLVASDHWGLPGKRYLPPFKIPPISNPFLIVPTNDLSDSHVASLASTKS